MGLTLIASLGFFLRLAVVLGVPTQPIDDFWSYFLRSQALAERGEYGVVPGKPDASYPPGYPLLLSLAQTASDPLLAARLLNVLLGTAAVVLTGLLTRRLWGEAAGWMAAALAALYPRAVAMSGILASENLFSPFLLLSVLLLAGSWDRPRDLRGAAWAGVALGLLTLTRPIGYLFWALWPASSWIAGKRWRAILAETLLVLAVQHAVLLPWAVRNQATLGRFTFLSSVGGVDLFIGNNPQATGVWMYWVPALKEIHPGLDGRPAFEVDDLARDAALAWMRENPTKAASLYLVKLRHILFEDESYALHYLVTGIGDAFPDQGRAVVAGPHFLKTHERAAATVLNGFHRATFWLGLAGCLGLALAALRKKSRRYAAQAFLLLGGAAYFVLLAAVFLASTRFRWPAMDLLLPATALAMTWIARRRRPVEQP